MANRVIQSAPLSERSLGSFLQDLHTVQTLDDFAVFVMREVPRLVASDATSYTEINPRLRRSMGALDSPEGQRIYERHAAQFDQHVHQHPLVVHFQREPDDGPRKITDFMTVEAWRETDLYREFYRHFNLSYQMVVSLPAEAPSLIGIAFNRRNTDFDENDRAILSLLRPHLVQAFRNVLDREVLTERVESAEQALETLGGGVITLSDQHEIVSVTDFARQCLQDFFPHHNVDEERLPAKVQDWVLYDSSQPLRLERGTARLTLHLETSENGTHNLIVLNRHTPADSTESLKALGLTNREAEVLYWVAQGKSNPEIAIIHGLSIQTIKKQVEMILKKLRVNNRTSAAVKAIEQLGTANRREKS